MRKNIEVVRLICSILDKLTPSVFEGISEYQQLITHVEDRAGHDIWYAIDASKKRELNGLQVTFGDWDLQNS